MDVKMNCGENTNSSIWGCCSFFSEIERLAKDDYVPTDNDILKVRNRTQGVIERNLRVNNYSYR